MKRPRFPVVVIVALIAANLLLVGTVVYPVSMDAPRSAADAFEPADSAAFALAATVEVDGDPTLRVEGTVADSGEKYVRIEQEDSIVERYQPDGVDGPEHVRYVIDDAELDDRLEHLESDDAVTVLGVERSGESTTIRAVDAEPGADVGDRIRGAASVVTTQLALVQYDRLDEEGQAETVVLQPESGWYAGDQPYRVAGAEGTVETDPETSDLYAADVRWELTRGTETYLHYLVNRESTVRQTITYDYRTEDVAVDPPDWIVESPDDR